MATDPETFRAPPEPPELGRDTLIVTPTYNERATLEPFVESVLGVAPLAHVLIVDDNSPDGTGSLADDLASRDHRVSVLHRPSKLGLGTAYSAAFQQGLRESYRFFFAMDADLSHDPQHLPELLRALDAGADLVIGSRNVPGGELLGWGPGRKLLSKSSALYSRVVLGVGVRDLTSGYKAYTRRTLELLFAERLESSGYSFQIETTFRALQLGLRVVEVPIVFHDRQVGSSKMDRQIVLEAVGAVWKLRFGPLRERLPRWTRK